MIESTFMFDSNDDSYTCDLNKFCEFQVKTKWYMIISRFESILCSLNEPLTKRSIYE